MFVRHLLASCTILLLSLFGASISSQVLSNSAAPNVWQQQSFSRDSLLGRSAVNHSVDLTGFKQFAHEFISKANQFSFTSQFTQWLDQFKARLNKTIRIIEKIALQICGISTSTGPKVAKSKQVQGNQSCGFLTQVKQYLLKSTSTATRWLRKMFTHSSNVWSKEHIEPINRSKRSLHSGSLERSIGDAGQTLKKSNKVPKVHYRANSLSQLRPGVHRWMDTIRRRLNINRNNPSESPSTSGLISNPDHERNDPSGNSNQRQTKAKRRKSLRHCLTPQCLRTQNYDANDDQLVAQASAEAIRFKEDIARKANPKKFSHSKHEKKRILNSVDNDLMIGGRPGGPGSKTLMKPRKRYHYKIPVNGERKMVSFNGRVLPDISEQQNY